MKPGVVLVTGGSRGIGRAVVDALLAEGRHVALTYRESEAAAREIVAASSGKARAYRYDLADRARPGALIPEIEEAQGPVEGLVNNAAIRRDALLASTPDADWDEVIDANLGAAFRCCRAVLPGMIARRAGSIVNVASLTAMRGVAGQASYGASKAGLIGLQVARARGGAPPRAGQRRRPRPRHDRDGRGRPRGAAPGAAGDRGAPFGNGPRGRRRDDRLPAVRSRARDHGAGDPRGRGIDRLT